MSKFTDTSMIRVVEEDFENEDNYLRNLDNNPDNSMTRSLNRPYSTT